MDGLKQIAEVVNPGAWSRPGAEPSKRSATAIPAVFDTDRALDFQAVEGVIDRDLPETVRASLKDSWRTWTGADGQFDCELSRYEFGGAPDRDVDRAIAILKAANRSTPAEVAAKAVTALRLRTKARPEHKNDLDALVTIFADDLSAYPPDVVVDACKVWARENKWFPAWSELLDYLEPRVRKRRLMLDALSAMATR